jgi:hypothetical protein
MKNFTIWLCIAVITITLILNHLTVTGMSDTVKSLQGQVNELLEERR